MHAVLKARTIRRIRQLRFSVAGLFVFTAGAALGFAHYNYHPLAWTDALLVAGTFWLVFGVGQQLGDLWRGRQGCLSHDTEYGCGWYLAVVWRLAAIVAVTAYFLIEELLHNGVIAIAKSHGFYSLMADDTSLRKAIFYLFLAMLLGSAGRGRRYPARRKYLSSLGLVLGCFLAFIVWSDQTMIIFYVDLAIKNIEISSPLKFAPDDIDPRLDYRAIRFLQASFVGTLAAGITVVSIYRWARTRRPAGLALWVIVGLAGLCGVAAYDLWLYRGGLHDFSPEFAVSYVLLPAHTWIWAAVLVTSLAGIAAYQWTVERREAFSSGDTLAVCAATYLNARPVVAMLVAVAILGQIVEPLVRLRHDFWDPYYVLLSPLAYVQCGVAILAAAAAFNGWRRRSYPLVIARVSVRPWRLFATWLLLLTTLSAGMFPLTAFCFSIWYLLGYT